MKIELLTNPGPQFREIAKVIADGAAPEWLVDGLEHFSHFISTDPHDAELRQTSKGRVEEMQRAVDVLLTWLPIYQCLPLGIRCPDDVLVVLRALPWIKKDLDRLSQEHTGRPTDWRRATCAAVVFEGAKLVSGKASAGSARLQRACMEYWRACGHREHDVPENWRRHLAKDGQWVRSILVAVQNQQ
jgi:hypothetical protein